MKIPTSMKVLLATSALLTSNVWANEFELSGHIAVEERYFFDKPESTQQLSHTQTSIALEPEFYWSWDQGNDSVTFKPYYRLDDQDSERSHFDIRELSYIHASDNWEVRAGIRKEFWGVTEFQHLVDVINQTDTVEDIDGEDKLGQLMLNLSLVKDWGIIDLYLLPGFRERTFAGEDGRLRAPILIDNDNVMYQSSAGKQHLDLAARWSHSIGDFDLGSYWFQGTNREPILTVKPEQEELVLTQYYTQMTQLGFDAQATKGDWLYKFETIYRHTDYDDFWATQVGFEYSFIGIFDTNLDLGLLMEHSWDSRGETSNSEPGAQLQNDLFFGSRLAFNDMQSSEVLMGFSTDLDHSATSFLIEANRRLGEEFKASIDVRLFNSSTDFDQLYMLKNDDHVQLSIAWYF